MRTSQQSQSTADASPSPNQSLSFVLHTADSYFNVSQIQARLEEADTSRSNAPPNLASLGQKLEAPDTPKPQEVLEQQQQYEKLGLTGNVISATAHLPWTIGITKDGKIELAPYPGKSVLHDSLSYLSNSSTWHHTVVGWTGEVLSTLSPEFAELKEKDAIRPRAYSNEGHQIGNVTIHDPEGSGFKEAFTQHFKEQDSVTRDMIITKDHRRELETLLQHVFKNTIIPVWLGEWSEDQDNTLILSDQARWYRYSEEELHKKLDRVMVEQKDESTRAKMFEDYRRLNEAAANAILKVYMPGDIVWVSDYQLMLLPAILRQKLPSAYIAYFHHASWCPREMIAELPEHEVILKGLLGASVIGLPSSGLRHYLEDYYCDEMGLASAGDGLINTGTGLVNLVNVPTGVDVASVQHAAYEDKNVGQYMSTIRDTYKDKKIIVARARLDRPRGVSRLIEGFESLLDHNPQLQQQAVLFLITTPDRDVTQDDKAIINQEVASQILQVNSKWSSATHQPILYLARPLPAPELYALLRLADVGIVTSDHEHTNTLSMEFVVSQKEKCSPLLVSERSSEYQETSFNKSTSSQSSGMLSNSAAALQDCLSMSEDDKRRKHKVLFDYFAKHDATTFTDEFLTKARISFVNHSPARDAPLLDMKALNSRYAEAERRLFMFDYDGTLTPIVDDPDHALPTKLLLNSLPKLANNPENAVWLISGRSRVFLEQHFGDLKNIGLSAEHGSFVRKPGSTEWQNLAASMDMGWKNEVDTVFGQLEAEAPGSWIERKEVAMVWHYRNAADHDSCLAKAVKAKALLEGERVKSWDVEVMLGKANLEVRPRFLNKGVVAANLMGEAFGNKENGFVLCAGDDTTDEGKHVQSGWVDQNTDDAIDMFRAILSSKLKNEGIFSCLVAKNAKPSLAYYRTPEPTDLVDAVAQLSKL